MTNGEYESRTNHSLSEVLARLSGQDGAFISHDKVELVRGMGASSTTVNYTGFDGAGRFEGKYIPGLRVEDELFEAATRLLGEDLYPRVGRNYPLLSVVNHENGATESRVIDIAALLVKGQIAVRSVLPRMKMVDETLTVDYSPLIAELANKVGVSPESAVVVHGSERLSLAEAAPVSQTHLHTVCATKDGNSAYMLRDFDARDESALVLLQMDAATEYMKSSQRRVTTQGTGLEVELRIDSRPDVQTFLEELIDTVQELKCRLYCSKIYNDVTEKAEYTFMLVKDSLADRIVLPGAHGASLEVAVQAAYWSLRETQIEGGQ